jgi:hypothetical protein
LKASGNGVLADAFHYEIVGIRKYYPSPTRSAGVGVFAENHTAILEARNDAYDPSADFFMKCPQ